MTRLLQCPPLDRALIDWLDAVYPESHPSPGTGMDAIWHYAGQRSVVRLLKIEFERQNTTHVHVKAKEAGPTSDRAPAPRRGP